MANRETQLLEAERNAWQRKLGAVLTVCDQARSAADGEVRDALSRVYQRMCDTIGTAALNEASASFEDLIKLITNSGTAIPIPHGKVQLVVRRVGDQHIVHAVMGTHEEIVGVCTIEPEQP